jgi:CheY-like chemotaxis protein
MLPNTSTKGDEMFENENILLVEDDPNDVLLIQRAFQKAGLKDVLHVAREGQQAIDYLSGKGHYADRARFPLPFLLLLDLKMPGMSGFDVLQWVRRHSEMKRLLVVVLTSSNLQSDVDRAYELGANSYLIKPVEFGEMVNLIQRFEVYWSEINRTPTTAASTALLRTETLLN